MPRLSSLAEVFAGPNVLLYSGEISGHLAVGWFFVHVSEDYSGCYDR